MSPPPLKRRKLQSNAITSLDDDDEVEQKAQNYIRMDRRMLLMNESEFFELQFKDSAFEDSIKNEINIKGNKQDVLNLIEFIVTGTINLEMNVLKMFQLAGMYGVKRLQNALMIYILDELSTSNYVATMNTMSMKSSSILEVRDTRS